MIGKLPAGDVNAHLRGIQLLCLQPFVSLMGGQILLVKKFRSLYLGECKDNAHTPCHPNHAHHVILTTHTVSS